jgi:hypothetical protein
MEKKVSTASRTGWSIYCYIPPSSTITWRELVPLSEDSTLAQHILDTPRYAADCDRIFGSPFIVLGLEHGTERY